MLLLNSNFPRNQTKSLKKIHNFKNCSTRLTVELGESACQLSSWPQLRLTWQLQEAKSDEYEILALQFYIFTGRECILNHQHLKKCSFKWILWQWFETLISFKKLRPNIFLNSTAKPEAENSRIREGNRFLRERERERGRKLKRNASKVMSGTQIQINQIFKMIQIQKKMRKKKNWNQNQNTTGTRSGERVKMFRKQRHQLKVKGSRN